MIPPMPVPEMPLHPDSQSSPIAAMETGSTLPATDESVPAHMTKAEAADDDDAQDFYDTEEEEEEGETGVTLNELHEELIANATETRRGNRRTLDVLKNFGAVLDALSATVNDTHKAVRGLPTAQGPAESGELTREWAVALVEMADRLGRVAEGFARPPAATYSWWPAARNATAAWREAWAMQSAALGILRSHLESLLQRASLVRLEVIGRPFDPATMTAVESVVDHGKPDHTVLAELLPGWQHAATHQLIRPAQVKVSRLTSL